MVAALPGGLENELQHLHVLPNCRCHEVAAEKLCGLASERDDLQGLLLATLSRLEAVEGVVARADESSAAMEEKVRRGKGTGGRGNSKCQFYGGGPRGVAQGNCEPEPVQ